jgi:hypothetical protein
VEHTALSYTARLELAQRTGDKSLLTDAELADILNEFMWRSGVKLAPPGAPGADAVFTPDEVERGRVLGDVPRLDGLSDADLRAWVAYHDSVEVEQSDYHLHAAV